MGGIDPPQGLGMPLHAQDEAAAGNRDRLDQAVLGPGLDAQPRGQAVDRLVVQGVDQEGGDTALDPGEQAAGYLVARETGERAVSSFFGVGDG